MRYLGAGSGNLKKGREGEPARDPAPSNIGTENRNIRLALDKE